METKTKTEAPAGMDTIQDMPMSEDYALPATGKAHRFTNLNTTKHDVFDKAVLVRMDEQLQQVGNIWLPPDARDKQQLAELYGTVIAVGANAFAEAKREAASIGVPCDVPQEGDRVCIARYAGVMLDPKRTDGGHIRIMNDEDIIAIFRE